MINSNIKIRPVQPAELDNINTVIEAAIMNWDLPERVKRLSLPSYYYNEVDLQHFDIIIASENKSIFAVAAFEPAETSELPDNKTGLFLHGIYVHPDYQKQNIGSLLLNEIEKVIKERKLDGLLVKAQKDAIPFFVKYGMQALDVKDPAKDYKNRFWKSL